MDAEPPVDSAAGLLRVGAPGADARDEVDERGDALLAEAFARNEAGLYLGGVEPARMLWRVANCGTTPEPSALEPAPRPAPVRPENECFRLSSTRWIRRAWRFAVPQRTYSYSLRGNLPGLIGTPGFASSWRMTGRSSKHTTGSSGSSLRAHSRSTSSMRSTYSSLIVGTHHIFFPPRLEAMVREDDPRCLPAEPRGDPSFHRLKRDESNAPSRPPLPAACCRAEAAAWDADRRPSHARARAPGSASRSAPSLSGSCRQPRLQRSPCRPVSTSSAARDRHRSD
jgi:hypothetical protein